MVGAAPNAAFALAALAVLVAVMKPAAKASATAVDPSRNLRARLPNISAQILSEAEVASPICHLAQVRQITASSYRNFIEIDPVQHLRIILGVTSGRDSTNLVPLTQPRPGYSEP